MSLKVEVFTSPSCPYCPMAEKLVEEAKEEIGDSMEVEVINIMTDRQRAVDYGIMAVPAIAINGVVEFLGAPDKEELMAKLKK
ncbi:glutaredoxin [Methanobrevibacter cuticularis]|uniref:Glutaredoxin n=1 Tax=Methanobrevibacter cuticularis TaxID=47311 RepID=A0A166F707_9EURY|nr:MJ0307 family thioredoxin [Methanobrevibacter cuticularis]KZX17381.1 glutaredoxin [Methanobrevibacter cuticularis]